MSRYHIESVVCGGCRQAMRFVKLLAIVVHDYRPGTAPAALCLYECDTPDCGGSVTVEGDLDQ